MARKSAQSPSKGTSSQPHTSGVQVSWSEADTNVLIGLVTTHKASAGEGLNFKASFWNTVAAALSNPSKGAPKTAKACKDKWKRVCSFLTDQSYIRLIMYSSERHTML